MALPSAQFYRLGDKKEENWKADCAGGQLMCSMPDYERKIGVWGNGERGF